MTKTLLSALLFSTFSSFAAESACDHPKNDFDGLYCMNKVYMQADKELNESYGKLAKQLDVQVRRHSRAAS